MAIKTKEEMYALKQSAEHGDAQAQYEWAYNFLEDPSYRMFKSLREPVEMLEKAAGQEHPAACWLLGKVYLGYYMDDAGMLADDEDSYEYPDKPALGIMYLHKAANMGYPMAYYELATNTIYSTENEADEWMQKAIACSDPDVLYKLYVHYVVKSTHLSFDGPDGDMTAEKAGEIADELLKRAADCGSADAKTDIAHSEIQRNGDTAAITGAIRLYEEAAELGNVTAMTELADIYREGRKTTKNLGRAKALLEKALDADGAVLLRDDIQRKIDSIEQEMNGSAKPEPAPARPQPAAPAKPADPAPAKPEASEYTVRTRHVDWDCVWASVFAIAAAYVFTKGTPLYIYVHDNARNMNTLMYLLGQVAAIAISTVGGAAAGFLVLLGILPELCILGGIAGGIGGLITVLCYELPEVYAIALNVAKVVMAIAAANIVIRLFLGLFKRKR